jgi:hypothetical protein
MVMVTRDWLKDSDSIREAFRGLKQPSGIGKKVWLVSFLEGTRMTPEKLEKVSHPFPLSYPARYLHLSLNAF